MAELIKGQVSGMQQRFEPGGAVWDFRVERTDPSGKPLPRVAVELRGQSFQGSINNGDWVELFGEWRSGDVVKVDEVKNLTTNATVRTQAVPRVKGVSGSGWALLIPFVFLAVIGAGVGLVFLVNRDSDTPATPTSAAIVLSSTSAHRGETLTVSGTGFAPDEPVQIRFHTTVLATVQADRNGSFPSQAVRIPADWPFAGQFDLVAVGQKSLRSVHSPLDLVCTTSLPRSCK